MPVVTVAAIVGAVVVVVLLMIVGASRYKKVGPEDALIITGKGGQKIVIGGGAFVMPVIQMTRTLNLNANTVEVHRENIYTKNRIPIVVDAVLVYKVKGSEDAVKLASQSFQGKSPEKISDMIERVAEGAFRDICGKMTPEDINEKRDEFQNEVTKVAQDHFDKIGIDLVSFVVTHITDQKDYFKNLGVPASAEVDKEARIKKAQADREAIVVEAEQNLGGKKKQAETEAEIAEAQKDRDVKKAQYNATVAEENAKAQQAGPKAEAIAKQGVVQEQTNLAEKMAEKRQKELLAEQVRPAEAQKDATIAKAEGEKKSAVLKGEGEGEAARARGEGEAAGNKAKLFAEADGLEKKAEAMKKFNDAGASLQVAMLLVEKLPDIVRAAASPITAIEKMQVIDFGGSGGVNGAGGGAGPIGKLLSIPPQVLAQADMSLKAVMGIGLGEFIQLIRKGDFTSLTSEKTGDKKEAAVEEKKLTTAASEPGTSPEPSPQ